MQHTDGARDSLLFYKGKTHARACENVDPKKHRALLGLAGASLPVPNNDMTLASEKNVAESRGTEHYDIPSKVSQTEEEHHCPSLSQAPDVEDSLSLSQSTP